MATQPIETMDITPSPRILWVLGQIPFRPWQAIAELVDNALDEFLSAERVGVLEEGARIDILWSNSNVPAGDRTLEIVDNGRGISLDVVSKAVRAGYTSNDPIGNLGLFGMGFNIATANLGSVTQFLSTRAGDAAWQGVEIDFGDLARRGSFAAPIVTEPKKSTSDNGTRVVIKQLNEGAYAELREREAELRRTLEDVYAPILRQKKVGIYVNGQKLTARPYCVWSSERAVVREGSQVPAKIEIDRDLGSALFDVERNQYLPGAVEADLRAAIAQGGSLPENVVERHRKLRGWVGVQRYADPNDFGIDFVRNGRKILIKDKRLFSWENPLTGELVLEYPVELGTTVGGRLVGELHVDYLVPTYQKNDFDRNEGSWRETILAVRGDGPMLPKRRKAMGYADSPSAPLALLANAYRRLDPGTRNLAAPNTTAREWAKHFFKGDPSYQDDETWWKAAQEADKARADKGGSTAAPVDSGAQASDDVDEYAPPSHAGGTEPGQVTPTTPQQPAPASADTSIDVLTQNSKRIESLSGDFSYGQTAALRVRAYAFESPVGILRNSKRLPCVLIQDGNECDFFYDPSHPLIRDYPITPRDLLAIYLAERFKARDGLPDLVQVVNGIFENRFKDHRVERSVLQDRAYNLLEDLRFSFEVNLAPVASEVLDLIHESAGELEETTLALIDNPELLGKFQDKDATAISVLGLVPGRTLPRLLDKFPEHLMDGKVFTLPFMQITLPDEKATARARLEAKKRVQSYLEDVVALSSSNLTKASKDELRRAAFSLALLQDGMPE